MRSPRSPGLAPLALLLVSCGSSSTLECDPIPVPTYTGPLLAPIDLAIRDAAQARASRRTPLAPAIGERLDAAFVRAQSPSIAAASAAILTDDGQTWSTGGRGKFWWGSVGKTFTAMLTLDLQARGALDLATRVGDWVAHIPEPNAVTIDELLSHTSGLSNTDPNQQRDLWKHVPPDQLLRDSVGQRSPPCVQAEWRYSNAGYLVLGLVIEAVEQRPYHEVMNELLQARLGSNSLIAIGPGAAPDDVALPVGDPPASITTPFAAATIVGSAPNMAIAWQRFLAGGIVSSADVESMLTPLHSRGERGQFYGRGVGVYVTRSGDVMIGHTGSISGARAFVAWSWRHRAVVAVALTGAGDPRRIADALLTELMVPMTD